MTEEARDLRTIVRSDEVVYSRTLDAHAQILHQRAAGITDDTRLSAQGAKTTSCLAEQKLPYL
eukprot:726589-Pyramimonas_sp.AAC.1